MAASRPARARPVAGARSTIVAVATPVNTPADTPDSSRPANRAGEAVRDQEHQGTGRGHAEPGEQHGLAPDLVRQPSDQQQRGQHADRVGREDDGDHSPPNPSSRS